MDEIQKLNKNEISLPAENLEYLNKELINIREDLLDNKYIIEARKVLQAGGLRSAIGSYWNAVVDDIRRKIIHRSLDLFNKEMKTSINSYEDFQTHLTDYDLIEGAYRIGVLSWEGKKIINQARETRNIFDGHPDSSDPNLFKVLNMIADCNRYVLSQEFPLPIINVNDYLSKMDTDTYDKNDLLVEQAFIDLPEIYKTELANKLYTYYSGDSISTRFRANIEFSFPILWRVLPKESRQQIGHRFDREFLEGDSSKNDKSTNLLSLVDGLRYTTSTTRKLIFEPWIKYLEDHLDDWSDEAKAVRVLESYGSLIPDNLIDRFVSAITLTFIGYKGSSFYSSRTSFFSNAAAPRITNMFERFDNNSVSAFINNIRTNSKLKSRIKSPAKLNRLRTLGEILLNKPEIVDKNREFLELLVNGENTMEFYEEIGLKDKGPFTISDII